MAAVLVGGIIIIWLALSGGRALLSAGGIQLHWPADLVAPLLLAVLETLLFLLTVPDAPLLEEARRWPVAGALVALAWVINGAVAGRLWVARRRAA